MLAMGNKLAGHEYRAADEHTCVACSNPDREVVGQPAGMATFRFGRSLAASSFELRGKSVSFLAVRGRAHEAVRIRRENMVARPDLPTIDSITSQKERKSMGCVTAAVQHGISRAGLTLLLPRIDNFASLHE